MMRMADAWVRGTHPWCGWIRLVLLPAMLAPIWFGAMWGGMVIMTVWMMLPMLFPKPAGGSRWMTRACLGVQIWRSRPLGDPVGLLLVILSVGIIALAMLFAGRQDGLWLAVCVVCHVSLYVIFLTRCASSFDDRMRDGP